MDDTGKPQPTQDGTINAEPAPGDIKNAAKWAQPTDGSVAIIQI